MADFREFELVPHCHATERFIGGKGAVYFSANGKTYVDLNEINTVLGQHNEAFIEAIERALRGFTAAKGDIAAKQELFQWLDSTTNGKFTAVHLTSSGSENVDNAVRVAKKMTGRTEVLSFWNSIHGRSWLSACMSGVPRRKANYGPLAAGIVFLPYPNCADCPLNCKRGECSMECLNLAKRMYQSASAQDAAAIIVEPWQGNGVIVPPPGYLKRLQDWVRSEGILLIVDENQSGMGRSGKMYRYEEEGLDPDILLLGKSLGNGLHISAMLLKQKPASQELLAVFGGGSGDETLACSAACEVFRQLDGGLLEHISAMGKLLNDGFLELQSSPLVLESRGVGLAAAIEFCSVDICERIVSELYENGFMVGKVGRTVLCRPPYVISEQDIRAFLHTLTESINRQ